LTKEGEEKEAHIKLQKEKTTKMTKKLENIGPVFHKHSTSEEEENFPSIKKLLTRRGNQRRAVGLKMTNLQEQ